MLTEPFPEIAPWPPVRHTPPLAPDFPSAFDGLVDLFQHVWSNYAGYEFEDWQIQLLRSILELYPAGHPRAGQLRWIQVVVSLGRQNGKTEIAAALALWALLVKNTAEIVGIASNVDQARLVYDRTLKAVRGTPKLAAMFPSATQTRGIRSVTGGKYSTKAAKSAALQGIPIDLGLVDELHIVSPDLWTDLVNGTGDRPNCLVIGITTAGDDDSELLLHLYTQGDTAIDAGDKARFGFFLWEAPEARIPSEDDTLGRYLAYANPAIASGRRDLETAIVTVRGMPETDAIRYRLNRFVNDESSLLFSLSRWMDGRTAEPFPRSVRPVFTVDRTPDHSYASIHAFAQQDDGTTYCDVVASFVNPTLADLISACAKLNRYSPVTFGMDRRFMSDVGDALALQGLPVTLTTYGDLLNGSATFYSKMIQGKLRHPAHPLMTVQIPLAKRKSLPEGWRVERSVSSDGVIGHILGVHLAETQQDLPTQIF